MSSRLRQPPGRRRADRVVGAFLALLGIAVAVVAIAALRHPNGRQAKAVTLQTSTVTATATRTTTGSARPSTSAHPSQSSTKASSPAAHKVPLVVLNNTQVPQLADTARSRFENAGWTVTSVGNITNDILSTCAYYDPSDPANLAAALELQREFPAIKRVKEKFPELPPGPIVVVLTADYS
jgi:hypothetical protein